MIPNQIEIFFSYSKADIKLRDELAKHLRGLERKGVITAWHESEISAGKERAEEIKKHLNSASIILLLVSPDFIASDELWQDEVTRAMERDEAKEACVIPVLLRSCVWQDTPFAKLQALPRNGEAITSWQNQDAAFTDVVKDIRQAVKKISRQQILNDPSKPFIRKLFLLIPWVALFKTFVSSGGVTLIVLIMRLAGIFEPSELWFYNQMMRLQLKEDPDRRLLLVEITQQDIQQYGRGPSQQQNQNTFDNIPIYGASLPDKVIYQLLKTLLDKKATVIGVDLHRDFEAYNNNLKKLFTDNNTNERLIFICKIPDIGQTNDGYAPPTDVPEEQVGFSDFLVDNDGVIRRQLLRMEAKKDKNSKCGTSNNRELMDSFAFKIAQKYLEITTNKKFDAKQEDDTLTYNGIPLKPLDIAEQGGYSLKQNFNGYQILLNYRNVKNPNDKFFKVPTKDSSLNVARIVSVQDILENKITDELVKDNIVLIGVAIDTYDSTSPTPFSTGGADPPMWGLYIQAQQVSQIVSAALDKPPRPLLKVCPFEYDMLWVIFWAALGAILPQLCQEPKKLILIAGILVLVLYTFCLVLFIFPTKAWISLTPTLAAFLGTPTILILIEFQFQKTQSKSNSP